MKFAPVCLFLAAVLSPISCSDNLFDYAPYVKGWVNRRIATEKVVVFGRSNCCRTSAVVDVLKELIPDQFGVYLLQDFSNYSSFINYFRRSTGKGELPLIFMGGKFYGGYDRFRADKKNNMLKALLNMAGCTFDEPSTEDSILTESEKIDYLYKEINIKI